MHENIVWVINLQKCAQDITCGNTPPFWEKIVLWMKIASKVTVGAVASSLAICCRCALPFVQAQALTSPVHFSVENMREVRALCLLVQVSVAGLQG